MSEVTIGQFLPGNSVAHRLDPRTKLMLLVGLIVLVFITNSLAGVAYIVLVTAIIIAFTRVPVKLYFKGLKAIWAIVIFSALLNIFYIKGSEETLLLSFWKIQIYWEGIRQSIIIVTRLVCMILLSSALSYTTSPTDLTSAIESLLKPLKLFGVKVHDLSMMMTIALRFVPTLFEETQKIMSAQKARGADMESGSLMQRIRALVPIIVPLFVSSYRRAYDLAMAMECRCYTGDGKRTRMNRLRYGVRDFFAAIFFIVVCAGTVAVRMYASSWIKIAMAYLEGMMA